MESVNAIGRIGGAEGLPWLFEDMMQPDMNGVKETERVKIEHGAELKEYLGDEKSFVFGRELLRVLALEAVDNMLARIDAVKSKSES